MATIFSKTGTACLFLFTSFAAISSTDESPSQAKIDIINAKMQSLNIPVNAVNKSEINGLYEVITNGEIYYVSDDAKYLINGNIYDLDNQMANVTGEKKAKLSQDKILENMDRLTAFEKDMIVFKANNEKHVINVFTDPTCAYCQKLHAQIDDYNKLGITIRYLAFPRGGIESATYRNMVSIWCSDDPKTAMTLAKSRKEVPFKSCENTVKEQYELGVFFGVNGTPALVLEDGSLQPGYLPPKQLIQLLDSRVKS